MTSEVLVENSNSTRYRNDDRSQLSNVRSENDFDRYLVLVVGVDDNDDLFRNLSRILSKDLVRSFKGIEASFELINSLKQTKIFLIISGELAKHHTFKDLIAEGIIGFYIYCMPEDTNMKWSIVGDRMRSAVADSTTLLVQLHTDINRFNGRWSFDEKSFQKALTNKSQWYHLFLLVISYLPKQSQECYAAMFEQCRAYYSGSNLMIEQINQFEQTYDSRSPISEYTRDSFVYRIINHALRTQNMNIIQQFSPFISDLHSALRQCHHEYIDSNRQLPRSVYRGQYLSVQELNSLRSIWTSNNPTITLTTFSSTSLDPQVAMEFLVSSSDDQIPCLFEIIFTDAYNENQKNFFYGFEDVFANIASLSVLPNEQEVLFTPGTHFCIKSIEDPINQSKFPWVFIGLEIVSKADKDSRFNYSNIIQRLKNEKNPKIFRDILNMLKDNAEDEFKFQSTNWKNWWNALKTQWQKNYLSDADQPLDVIFYNCFTENPRWSRKAIEKHKEALQFIPVIQANRTSFDALFQPYKAWADEPSIWIALYEDYLKDFCRNGSEQAVKCLCFTGEIYRKIADYQTALACYEKAQLLNTDDEYHMNQEIQKQIKIVTKLLKKVATPEKQHTVRKEKSSDYRGTHSEKQWVVAEMIKRSAADRSSIQSVLFRISRFIEERQRSYDIYESKIILRFPHEVTDDLSVDDYYSNFLLALQKHLSNGISTADAANDKRLSMKRFHRYMNEREKFQALETFLRPFEMKLEFIRVHLFPHLKRFLKKLTTLLVMCFFYICVQQHGNELFVDNDSLIAMINPRTKQPEFLNLHAYDMRTHLEGLEEENTGNEKVSITIPNHKRFIPNDLFDEFLEELHPK